MFQRLLKLEWKAFFRSANVGRNIGVKIFLGFLALYFAVVFLAAGVGLYFGLEELAPENEPILLVNRYLLMWFVVELMLRFTLQNLPVTHARPLLLQRIKRSQIVHYLLGKSAASFFNLLAPLVFIPFTVINITRSGYGLTSLLSWLIAVLALVLTVNFANILIQKRFAENLKALLPFVLSCLALYALDYYGVFSVSSLFGSAFNTILLYPYLVVVPILIAIVSYIACFKSLIGSFYLDGHIRGKTERYRDDNFGWTNRFGAMAPFLQLDLRLIQRNKRPRTAMYLSLFLLLYGLMFYTNPSYDGSGMLVFVGVFITGIFMMSFGQFIPAWDSSYYSMMMSQNIPMSLYLESKVTLMYGSIIILAFLGIPYAYFGWHILFINLACALFNMGINVPAILYAGSFNRKRIDFDKSQFFNYQGTGAAQWIISIPTLLVPVIIWHAGAALLNPHTATAILAVLGLIGIFLKRVYMPRIVDAYRKRKHTMINGFKQQEN